MIKFLEKDLFFNLIFILLCKVVAKGGMVRCHHGWCLGNCYSTSPQKKEKKYSSFSFYSFSLLIKWLLLSKLKKGLCIHFLLSFFHSFFVSLIHSFFFNFSSILYSHFQPYFSVILSFLGASFFFFCVPERIFDWQLN